MYTTYNTHGLNKVTINIQHPVKEWLEAKFLPYAILNIGAMEYVIKWNSLYNSAGRYKELQYLIHCNSMYKTCPFLANGVRGALLDCKHQNITRYASLLYKQNQLYFVWKRANQLSDNSMYINVRVCVLGFSAVRSYYTAMFVVVGIAHQSQ